MMFNGFLVYGDSDTSDVTKSSNEPLSLAESSTSDSTRALTLESQLHATRQILKNTEETVRVQAESLTLAEARIAELSKKLQTDKNTSVDTTKILTRSCYCKCCVEKLDVSVSADFQKQVTRDCSSTCCVETVDVSAGADLLIDRDVLSAHPDKLSIVEELYRECFYEAAKQEEMIDILRKSQVDLRLRDRAKAEQICRLQRALHSHKWGLERYQDIAAEVERLKSEIMSFINGSNNDSGVWGAGGAEEELASGLRHVADQLLRLRDLLTGECTCGLEEENKKLRQTNDSLNQEVSQLRDRVRELEKSLEEKEKLHENYDKQIKDKEEELVIVRQRLAELKGSRDEGGVCDALMGRLQHLQALLNEKIDQLKTAEDCCQRQEESTQQLREQLNKMDRGAKENNSMRCDQTAQWRAQLTYGGRRVRSLEAELRAACRVCAQLAGGFSEKGAGQHSVWPETQRCCETLCGTARRAVYDALQLLRHKQVEQEKTIKEQQSVIRSLRESRPGSVLTDPPSGMHAGRWAETGCESTLCTHYTGSRHTDTSRLSHAARWAESGYGAGCDSAHCSRYSDAASPPPVPPRRLMKKQPLCYDQTQLSPTAEILERVERAHEALESAQRRWGRRARDHQSDKRL